MSAKQSRTSQASTDEIAAQVAEEFRTQVANRDATIRLLEFTTSGLAESNRLLRGKLESDWEKPKRFVAIVTVILGMLFAINIYSQVVATAELTKRADDLRQHTAESKAQFA